MKNFIMVDNEMMLNNENFNTFTRIGTEGFTLYCYLLTQQGQKSYCQVSLKMIHSFMNRKFENPKSLTYTKTKECKVGTMKDKKTIIHNLNTLNKEKLITLDYKETYGLNEILTIRVTRIETTNFTMISEDLFVDYIHKIGHIGWTLLYILTKLHNGEYGSCSSEGFANPTEEYLKSIIKKDVKTIRAYLYLLKDYKLITIDKNEPIYKGKVYKDNKEIDFYEFIPNNYVVKNRLMNNKYYIERREKE